MTISIEDYFGRWINDPEKTPEVIANAEELLKRINNLFKDTKFNLVVTSGFRTINHNKIIGGAVNSLHCQGLAIDLSDSDKEIGDHLVRHIELLMMNNLYMESLQSTHASNRPSARWVHLQAKAPKSGARIFLPFIPR